ncbi:uncharacterized protein [Ptychodera flava]|uniref:uncharacterized protein n=1 Tax=Ptychodera flava TaxID=63121 RepID=UPI003969CC4F
MTDVRLELQQEREKVKLLQMENAQLRERITKVETESDYVSSQLKRNNIVVHGIEEAENGHETWAESEEKVKTLLKDELEIDTVEFERAHRLNTRSRPRPIIAKCVSFKDKEQVLSAAAKWKDTNTQYRIAEDFTTRVRHIRKNLSKFLRQAREQNKRCRLSYDKIVIEGKTYTYDALNDDIKPVGRPR